MQVLMSFLPMLAGVYLLDWYFTPEVKGALVEDR